MSANIKYLNYHGNAVILKNVKELQYEREDGSGKEPFSHGKAVDNVPIELDFSNGNQTVIAPDGTLVKSAVIVKPETLIPENVKKGVNIAGIDGVSVGNLTTLSVTKNGTYTPSGGAIDFINGGTYPFKATYTQEFIKPMYEQASAMYEFTLNDFTTGAFLIDNNDIGNNGLAAIRFAFGENIYYGLLKESAEPRFWVPAEVAAAFGHSAAGWYAPLDESAMSFAPSAIPDYPIVSGAHYLVGLSEISSIFDLSEFDGYSSVEVNVQAETEDLTITPNFSGGDILVEPSEGKLLSSVTVEKPETLTAENIAAGVEIAGILGTHQGGGGGGDFDTSDESLKYFLFTIDGEAKEIQLGKVLYAKISQGSGKYDVNVPNKMGGYRTVIDTSYSDYSNGFFTNAYVTNVMIGENVRFANNSMGSLFKSCPRFNQPIAVLNGVNNIYALFNNCANFNQPFTIPKHVNTASSSFSGCKNFNQPITIEERDAECGELLLSGMVDGCNNFNQPITFPNGSFYLGSTFEGCTAFNQPIIANNITNLYSTFRGCTSFNQPIKIHGNFNYIGDTFDGCVNFNSPIELVTSSASLRMYGTFNNCVNFNQPFTVPSVTNNMYTAFKNCKNFNQPITIPSAVNNMYETFANCTMMAQDITIYSKIINNVKNMLYGKSNSRRINIYVPPACTTNTRIANTTSMYSMFGSSVTWTIDNANNCYYNATRNVYVYYTVGT